MTAAIDADALYNLLPAFVRLRDQTQGGGELYALMAVIAEQAQVVNAGLDQLYDDQFIETCASWVVPYIGDLIGFTPLRPLGPGQPAATRAEVANTIGYRRRKGTLAMLEQLASDVTGWPAIAVEYFTRLATTQYVRNHLRPDDAIVDARSPMTAVDIGGAFDVAPRTAEVRRIASRRGRTNIPNIGVWVWRLQPYRNLGHPARSVGTNRYTFDPFGGDVPLVNPPEKVSAPFVLAHRPNLPFFLQRYPLNVGPTVVTGYASTVPAAVYLNGVQVPPAAVGWCNLTNWTPPTAPIRVAIDPVLGRLVFNAAPPAGSNVTVDYTYAFSGDYGGGDYERPEPPAEAALPVTKVPAFDSLPALPTSGNHVVEIEDSGIYEGDITLTAGAGTMVVRAVDLQRPVVHGNVTITVVKGSAVTIRGLGITGTLTVSGTAEARVSIEHCSIRGTASWADPEATGGLSMDHSLCGAVVAAPGVGVKVTDSALDAGADTAAALSAGPGAAAGQVTISRSTLIGTLAATSVQLLENSIVTGPVVSTERQAGCVRYSALPVTGSSTPPRFRCQPDLEADAEVKAAQDATPGLPATAVAAIRTYVEGWLKPVFTSRTPGKPGYLQLSDATPAQIRSGAEGGDEMGVFNGIYAGRREANLLFRLNEYLRVGLEVGIFHAT